MSTFCLIVAGILTLDMLLSRLFIRIKRLTPYLLVCAVAIIVISISNNVHIPHVKIPSVIETVRHIPLIPTSQMDVQYNVKPGVNLKTLNNKLRASIPKIVSAYQAELGATYIPTITSGDDYDRHKPNSAHYRGRALDFRLNDIHAARRRHAIYNRVKKYLGNDFIVIHESPGLVNEHLHIQLK